MPKTEIPNTDFGHVRFAASKIFLSFHPNVDSNGATFDFPWKARGFYMTTDQRDAGDFQMRYTFRYVVAEGPKAYTPPSPVSLQQRLSLLVRAAKPALLLMLGFVLVTAISVALSVSLGRCAIAMMMGRRLSLDSLYSVVGKDSQSFGDFATDINSHSAFVTDLRDIPRYLLNQRVPTADIPDVLSASIGTFFIYIVGRALGHLQGLRNIGEKYKWLMREKGQICLRAFYAVGLALFYIGMPLCEGAFLDLFFFRPVATESMILTRWPQWFVLGLPAFSLWWGCLNFTEFGVWLSPLIFVGSVEVVDRETLREVSANARQSMSSYADRSTKSQLPFKLSEYNRRTCTEALHKIPCTTRYRLAGMAHPASSVYRLRRDHCPLSAQAYSVCLRPFQHQHPQRGYIPFQPPSEFPPARHAHSRSQMAGDSRPGVSSHCSLVCVRVLLSETPIGRDVRNVHQQVWEKCYLLRKELVEFER